MKNVTTKSIILFFILCFSSQLPILAQGNPKQTKYTIKNAWWTNIIDNDKDGYTQNRKLHFDVDINKGTQKVSAEIYYKSKIYGGKFNLYCTTTTFTINGKNNADKVAVTIGYPNIQLSKGSYDFEIKIFSSYDNKLVLSWAKSDDWDLKDQKFETFNQDLNNYAKNKIKFDWVLPSTSFIDNDKDGFPSLRHLDIKVRAINTYQLTFYTKIFYKRSNTFGQIDPIYHLGYKHKPTQIPSGYQISFKLPISIPHITDNFSRGEFAFKVEVYDNKNNSLIGYYDKIDNDILSKIKMESALFDQLTLNVSQIWYDNIKDVDQDGFAKFRKLYFMVMANDNGDHKIYVKLYYKLNNSGNYNLYHVTPPFINSGFVKNKAYWIAIGAPHKELPRNIYDFKLDIYDYYSKKLITSVDSKNDQELNDIKFEKNIEEAISIDQDAKNIIKVIPKENFNKLKVIPLQTKYIISDTWWTDAKDRDSDGYTRYRRLHFNVDVESGTNKVYAKIYYKTSSSNSYTLYYTTTPFPVVAGLTKSDNYWIAVGKPHTQPPHNIYDFKIEIYEPGNNKWFVTMLPAVDSDLANNKFEKFSEDPFPK